ncbi:MAG: amidohydrolase family protein [Actinomycetia bacterium]|nr:amidohydrolase family protein [Actinomycetes bacterium]
MTTTLYRGGLVYNTAEPFATALVTQDDLVAWVGSDEAARVNADGVDVVVELDGALLTPAFVDAHVHTTSTGLNLSGLDLSDTKSLEEALARLEAHSRSVRGAVVLGHGWDETRWPEARPPRRDEVDRASYGGVVYLSRVDVHSCIASSALLALAPEVSNAAGYSADGWLSQQAHHVVRRIALDSVTPAQRRAAQRLCLQHAASLGIGMVHELGGPEISSADDFADLLATVGPESGVEVVGYWGEGGGPDVALSLGARGAAGDHFVDGAIGSRTAFLRDTYADAETHGAAYTTAATIRDHVIACSMAGVPAGYHVIGDGAMDLVVAGFTEAAEAIGDDVVRTAQHRLEHVEMVDGLARAVLARLGVLASVQPVFDAWWGGDTGMYTERLGAARAATLNPFASMQAAGIPLAFGSDAPVTPLAPWQAIRAAVHHHQPEERLTARSAFTAHTRGGWRAAGRRGGVLAPGEPATLALWQCDELVVETPDDRVAAWSTDPRAGVPGLPSLEPGTADPVCLRTIVAGRTVYTSDAVQPINPGRGK